MKKVLLAILLILVAAVAGLLAAPAFIDWNAYRSEFAAAISDRMGRDVKIGGDLDLALLPAPSINARNISVANIAGGHAQDFLTVGEIRMRLALGPLLRGQVSVGSLLLVDPVVVLETTADGRRNWAVEIARDGTERGAASYALPFDEIAIRNGELVWRSTDMAERRFEAIDLKLTGGTAAGPFRAEGKATLGTVPFGFSAKLGRAGADGASPFSVTLDLAEGAGQLAASGTARPAESMADGRISATSANAARLARALLGETAPDIPIGPLAAETAFEASAAGFAARNIEFRFGAVSVGGSLELVTGGDRPVVTVALEAGAVDLDELLAGRTTRGTGANNGAAGPTEHPLQLPVDFDGRLGVSVKAVRWRGGIVKNVEADIRLDGGVARLTSVAASLPGGTNATLSGQAQAGEGGILFDGDLAVVSDNLRAALIWGGVPAESLPDGRLRGFSYTSRLAVAPTAVSLGNFAATLDASRLAGAATIARRDRPSFGLRLDIDHIDFDAYFPPPKHGGEAGTAAEKGGGYADLARFDANLNVTAGSVTWRGKPLERLGLDARLFDGDIVLRKLSVGNMGSATLAVSGKIDDVPSGGRVALDLALDGRSAEQFAGFLGAKPDRVLQHLGRFGLQAHASGLQGDLEVAGQLAVTGGGLDLQGTLTGLDAGKPAWDLAVNLNHSDGARVLKLVDPGRRRGSIGALKATFRTKGSAAAWAVTDLRGTLGDMAFAGRLEGALDSPRPRYVVNLSTGSMDLDRLFPGRREAASAAPAPRGSARWSREEIDLSAMRAIDLTLTLQAASILRGDVRIDKADIGASLAGGVLTVPRFTGLLSGGPVEFVGRFDGSGDLPQLSATLTGRDVSARPALAALAGFDRLEGPVSFDFDLSSRGRNMFELVSALSGNGKVFGKVKGRLSDEERAKAGAAGIVGLILGEKVRQIGTAGDAVSTLIHAFANSRADLSGDVAIDRGIARTDNLLLAGRGATALTAGAADLANWRIDSTTRMHRAEDGDDPYMVIRLKGPLDGPDVRVSGTVLSGRRTETAPPLAAPVIPVDPVAPEDPDSRPKPEELLLDLLRNLGR